MLKQMQWAVPGLLSACLLGVTAPVLAESEMQAAAEPASASPGAPLQPRSIPEAKRSLISELLELTGGRAQYEQMNQIAFANMQQQLQPMLEQMVQGIGNLSPAAEQAMIDRISVSVSALTARIQQAIATEIPYEAVLEQVYYPVYDQYFTEEDLRNLIAFYRTPTGTRLVAVSPELFQTSLQLSDALFMPRIMEITNEWIRQQLDQMGTAPAQKL